MAGVWHRVFTPWGLLATLVVVGVLLLPGPDWAWFRITWQWDAGVRAGIGGGVVAGVAVSLALAGLNRRRATHLREALDAEANEDLWVLLRLVTGAHRMWVIRLLQTVHTVPGFADYVHFDRTAPLYDLCIRWITVSSRLLERIVAGEQVSDRGADLRSCYVLNAVAAFWRKAVNDAHLLHDLNATDIPEQAQERLQFLVEFSWAPGNAQRDRIVQRLDALTAGLVSPWHPDASDRLRAVRRRLDEAALDPLGTGGTAVAKACLDALGLEIDDLGEAAKSIHPDLAVPEDRWITSGTAMRAWLQAEEHRLGTQVWSSPDE